MKHVIAGIVAHVDAGKTTLSEAMLYQTGEVRKLGRVDNGDAFLDPDDLEKKRGITIFSHQANLTFQNLNLTLLDTPGHVDFASQTEQVLSVLDYAILVVSATDGVQGYTRTLWRLLERYQVPTFIFVNKMDVPGAQRETIVAELQRELAPGALAFGETLTPETEEEVAMQDNDVLANYLETGELADDTVRQLIQTRTVFPVFFGAALKLEGVSELLSGIEKWANEAPANSEFGAKVFKISRDEKGERLTWLRVTGGTLHPKDIILGGQKVNQLRAYNGVKSTTQTEVVAGGVTTIPGLHDTYPGQGIGAATDEAAPTLQPVLTYSFDPKGHDIHECLTILRELEDEDPQLHVTWQEQLQEIQVQIMGEIQLEVLKQLLLDRYQLDVDFGEGNILYKETIADTVEGVGHFEPLRHYAEVHLLLEPLSAGSGLVYDTNCSLEMLTHNWQQQVISNLKAKTQLGVLTGSPITDMKITLVGGRSHIKHTEGGDFREATWRALRQGLMMLKQRGKAVLLEPWYRFRLEVSQDQVGRAMNDIQRMSGTFETPDATDDNAKAVITGVAPVAEIQHYAQEVAAYTHGKGQLECLVDGYRPAHNAETVVTEMAYDPVADLANTPGSVFCAHGAGYPVAWDEVLSAAHVPYLN